MDFKKNVPEWRAEGTEPPESLKDSGFQVGYKPPAPYFNWFWNRVSACLTEIREKLSGHASNKENPHGVTAAQLGLDKVNNTSDAEKCVAFASKAGVARKSEYSMTVRLNGGRTESTDQFTYDGSTSRTVNITPEKIDAAEKDLSNVDDAVFKDKASGAGVGIPLADATSADGIAYTATVEGVSELYNGLIITIIPAINSAATNPTLNVNGLGEKMIRLPLSFNNAAMSMPKMDTYITAGRPLTLQYDAAYLNGDGIWKVFGKQKTSAQDLYGTVPVESGGTDATDAAGARQNLGVPSIGEMQQRDRVVNLLDNSWFVNPINQRGLTQYTGNMYTIDRWYTYSVNANTVVNNGYITITTSALMQRLNIDPDKTYTAAVKKPDGTVVIASGTFTQGFGSATIGIRCSMDAGYCRFLIEHGIGSSGLLWAALYEGAYTADTLPAYQYKGYAAELAECMRYYQVFGKKRLVQSTQPNGGFSISERFAIPMRVAPTITGTYVAWSTVASGNTVVEQTAALATSESRADGFRGYYTVGIATELMLLDFAFTASADL